MNRIRYTTALVTVLAAATLSTSVAVADEDWEEISIALPPEVALWDVAYDLGVDISDGDETVLEEGESGVIEGGHDFAITLLYRDAEAYLLTVGATGKAKCATPAVDTRFEVAPEAEAAARMLVTYLENGTDDVVTVFDSGPVELGFAHDRPVSFGTWLCVGPRK